MERAAQRERKDDAVPDSVLTAIATQEDQFSVLFDREWARTLMHEAADLMRARAKARGPGARLRVELLRLRFAEDRSIREIAAEWDMDPDAVHRAHAKAREEFHACLRQIVSFHAVRTEPDLDAECLRILGLLG